MSAWRLRRYDGADPFRIDVWRRVRAGAAESQRQRRPSAARGNDVVRDRLVPARAVQGAAGPDVAGGDRVLSRRRPARHRRRDGCASVACCAPWPAHCAPMSASQPLAGRTESRRSASAPADVSSPHPDAENRAMGRFRAPLAAARLVTLSVFETVTGYSEKAVRRKIEEGVWLQGHEFIKAPDGRILVDMEGYQRWAFGQRRV